MHLNRLIEPSEIAMLIEHIIENEAINGTTIGNNGRALPSKWVVK